MEVYFLITSKIDPIFKISQGCNIFQIFLNSLFLWWKMVLHTKFRTYSTKLEVPTSQNVVWPTIMAQTLDRILFQIMFIFIQVFWQNELSYGQCYVSFWIIFILEKNISMHSYWRKTYQCTHTGEKTYWCTHTGEKHINALILEKNHTNALILD